jgi:hypothetical protein
MRVFDFIFPAKNWSCQPGRWEMASSVQIPLTISMAGTGGWVVTG